MGVLDLLCITTDPDSTTFYGFAYAEDYSASLAQPQSAVLVMSNSSPSSPTDLTWSVVSMIDGSHLNGYPASVTSIDTSCSYSSQGVFTLLGQYKSTTSPGGRKVPFGFQYYPSGKMDPSFGFKGVGSWSNITVADGFNWSGDFNTRTFGYVNTTAAMVLVHASVSGTNNTVSLATFDEGTKTIAPMVVWNMNASIHGSSIRTLTIGHNRLYTFGSEVSSTTPGFLTAFPLDNISPTTPNSTIFNTTALTAPSSPYNACYHSSTPIVYTNHGALTILCGGKRDPAFKSAIYTTQTATFITEVGQPVWFDADVIGMDYFVPIGPDTGTGFISIGAGSTFGLIRKEGTMFAFGNDNRFIYTHLLNKVNVTNPIRSNPNLLLQTPPPSDSPSSFSTGSILGIAAGAVVVLIGVVLLLIRRRRSRRDKDNKNVAFNETADKEPSATAKDDDGISISSEKVGDNDGPNYLYLEGKYADNSNPEWRTGSTDMLPMAPITAVPEHLRDELKELQEQMRALQDQIRLSQFSSHPRPNVVTTVSSEKEPAPSATIEQYPGATTVAKEPSERRVHALAAGSSESLDLYAPSAPAYSSATVQQSSQESSAVTPEETADSSGRSGSALTPPSSQDTISYPTFS